MAVRGYARPPQDHPGYASGQFYSTYDGAYNSGAPSADLLYVYPVVLRAPTTIGSLFLRIATGGTGSAVKLALWANNPATGRPAGTPLVAANTGAATTSSSSTVSLAVANTVLPAGVYWVGSVHSGTPPTCTSLHITGGWGAFYIGTPSAATAILASGFTPAALSTAQTYANDIGARDLTGAAWTVVATTVVPVIGFGVA